MRINLVFIVLLLSFVDMSAVAQTNTATNGTLAIGILTIESSYARNTERPSRGVPDTVQFWIAPGGTWRIRTYATDHDIHPHSLGDLGKMKDRPIEFAREHISKHYGDVLASIVVLEFADTGDRRHQHSPASAHGAQAEGQLGGRQDRFCILESRRRTL